MKNNKFLKKVKGFLKRNSYALAISTCVVLAFIVVGVGLIAFNNQTDIIQEEVPTVTPGEPENEIPVGSNEIIKFVLPIENGEISKEYAENHLLEDKTTGFWQAHLAIDFKANNDSKVLSVYDGVVEKVENSMMDGMVITIKHSESLKSVYKCLSEDVLVKEGDKVSSNQEIGKVATNLTEKADGFHLHFELYENDKLVDPTPYFTIDK